MSAASLSVVVPTYRRRASVVRALTALTRQDIPAGEFEVIVAVDGSGDGTKEAIEAFRAPYELRVVGGEHRGRAAACNSALALAAGEVVLILDDDMEPAPGCLGAHRRHHAPGTAVCVMGGVPVRVGRDAPPAARFMAWKFALHLNNLARPQHTFALRDFYSGNTSIRRDVLLNVGLFDEAFTRYGNEDLELSLRLRAANVRLLYDPEALAVQHYEKNLVALARDTIEKGTTAVLLTRAHPNAFDELQLANYKGHSLGWRALRAALLHATRAYGTVGSAVLGGARALERTPIARRPMFYILLLDYFYWLGVQSALIEAPASGPLTQLAAELRHGPIRLLLHR
jgi:glycosyltransferase involved in cell wall biosynthesis